MDAVSPAITGFALGVALASAPGAVQAVLLTESIRGGLSRGLRALAGAHLTFGVLLVGVALGLTFAAPSGPALQIMRVVGAAFLLWLAADAFRSARNVRQASAAQRELPPAARGALAVILNPGAWFFLGAVASPLFALATLRGGVSGALLVAAALIVGALLGDVLVVIIGGVGVRRGGERVEQRMRQALAVALAALAVWLLADGLRS